MQDTRAQHAVAFGARACVCVETNKFRILAEIPPLGGSNKGALSAAERLRTGRYSRRPSRTHNNAPALGGMALLALIYSLIYWLRYSLSEYVRACVCVCVSVPLKCVSPGESVARSRSVGRSNITAAYMHNCAAHAFVRPSVRICINTNVYKRRKNELSRQRIDSIRLPVWSCEKKYREHVFSVVGGLVCVCVDIRIVSTHLTVSVRSMRRSIKIRCRVNGIGRPGLVSAGWQSKNHRIMSAMSAFR